MKAEVERQLALGRSIAEPGRFVVTTRAQRIATCEGFSPASFMVEAAFAFAFLSRRFDAIFIDCEPRLASLYRTVGFRPVHGAEYPSRSALGIDLLAMQASERSLPTRLRPAIEHMAEEFAREGHITHPSALLMARPAPRIAASA